MKRLILLSVYFFLSLLQAGELRQVGLLETSTLVSLEHDDDGAPLVLTLCPPQRFWKEHVDAPWNAFWSKKKSDWVELYPGWEEVPISEPTAPWNQPEPDRDPSAYPGKLWVPPTVLPLVKLDKPEVGASEIAEPLVVWLPDRVERRWTVRLKTSEESLATSVASGFLVQPENFYLSVLDHDQTQFTKMLGLVREGLDLGLISNNTPQTIADKNGEVHTVTTLRFRQIMVSYGMFCKSLWNTKKGN